MKFLSLKLIMLITFLIFSIDFLNIYRILKDSNIRIQNRYSFSTVVLEIWLKYLQKLLYIVCSENKNQIYVKSFQFSAPIIIQLLNRMTTHLLSEDKIYQKLQICLNKVSVIQSSKYFTVFIFRWPIKQNWRLAFFSRRYY